MDAFANIPSNGKYAMRFDEGSEDRLIGVALLDAGDDVLLASRQGKAIRFDAEDVREFVSRTSTGVRGMRLRGDDEVVSLSILHKGGIKDQDEREEYLRFAPWKPEKDGEMRDQTRFAELCEREQFILTVCANGYGKLSSAYEYRRTGRGGQGITNIDNIARNGPVVASFTATQGDQLMLVTDQAKLIRIGLDSLRVIGRASAGVRLFDVAEGEQIVSAVRLDEEAEPENEAEEAIVEEMVGRDSVETVPHTTPRSDDDMAGEPDE
jgi:DNA gyrase subunit A